MSSGSSFVVGWGEGEGRESEIILIATAARPKTPSPTKISTGRKFHWELAAVTGGEVEVEPATEVKGWLMSFS